MYLADKFLSLSWFLWRRAEDSVVGDKQTYTYLLGQL